MNETLQAKDQSNRPRCEAAHSPLPWRAIESHQYDSLEGAAQLIETSNMDAVCVMIDTDDGETCDANAAYIVKACNAFPELLSACKQAVDDCTVEGVPNFSRFQPTLSSMDALLSAIQKAEANG